MSTPQISPDWLNLPASARRPPHGARPRTPFPVLILNASPDTDCREVRAKVLNGTGYYTCSARTPADVLRLAAQMKCAAAVVCHSFSSAERRTVVEQLRKISPATRVVLLEDATGGAPEILLARLREVFGPEIRELPEPNVSLPMAI